MPRVAVVNNITIDGVMQAPARLDEDLRGGFQHGGWALPYNDEVKARIMAEGMAQGFRLLFGRRTYEDFYGDLVRSLMGPDLIDQYMLLIHPLVLGSGRRLFADGQAGAKLRLVDSVSTTTGVMIATYEPVETSARKNV